MRSTLSNLTQQGHPERASNESRGPVSRLPRRQNGSSQWQPKIMKILITGAKGMLGQMLASVLGEEHELILTDREEMDVTNELKVRKVIKFIKPDIIVHAAAYIDVENAESEPELARKINIEGSKNIAEAASKIDAAVIYISTDYVFDGKKNAPYTELDKPNPLSVYAKTKFLGECEIIKSCTKYYVLRVSWLFGECASGRNFVETMIGLSKTQSEIKVINDQIGSPTYTRDLAEAIKFILAKSAVSRQLSAQQRKTASDFLPYGIYNFSGAGETTRFGFTKEIFRQAKIKTKLTPIKAKEFCVVAPRPAYSYLDKTKIEKALNIKVRPWQEMLEDYLERRT